VPFVIKETKVEGQSDSLADRVSRRLGNDGDLSTRQAAATIRLAIGKVPQIWKGGHVALGTLWELYTQYPYMPRLRDRQVLDEGIDELPVIWQIDAFALASGYDETAERYIDLWTPEDKTPAPLATNSLLLVRPDVAVRQRNAEIPVTPDNHSTSTEDEAGQRVDPIPDHLDVDSQKFKTRFYGVKTLNTDKIAMDFKNIAEEVIAHFRAETSTNLTVRIEIEATDTSGFDENKVRTVSENAHTLKFEQSGFEES
jgi:hypothetical protein